MVHSDELCFICGVTPSVFLEFTDFDDSANSADSLTEALLAHFPSILSDIPTCKTREDLQTYLEEVYKRLEEEWDDFKDLAGAFRDCVAIGYFDDDGGVPRKKVDDPVVKYLFPDGRFVKKRWVGEATCGEFETVYRKVASDSGEGGAREVWNKSEEITRTGSNRQGGFGNFFLSECCLGFLEGWIEHATLPPMWDGRQLSFIGELWEIVNSRKAGRGWDGCLEWLEPGGAEKKLEETQQYLSTIIYGEVYPVKTAAALKSGEQYSKIKRVLYDDYGYWLFVSPHEWPEAPERKDLIPLTALGFDVPLRASQFSPSLGCFSRLAVEILCQIFRHLPDVATYLNLKLVCKRMHDLITDTKLALPVLREIIEPDPAREMFWIYPLENQPRERDNFMNCLYSWMSLKCPSVDKKSILSRDILFHHEFLLLHFIHALYTSDCSRNRRRLWKSVKKFEDVWVDYRRNGWEVNRFGLPYTEPQE